MSYRCESCNRPAQVITAPPPAPVPLDLPDHGQHDRPFMVCLACVPEEDRASAVELPGHTGAMAHLLAVRGDSLPEIQQPALAGSEPGGRP